LATSFVLLAVAAAGCGPAATDARATSEQPDPAADTTTQQADFQDDAVPVVVASAENGPVSSWIIASGNLEAIELVEVLAKVPGQVQPLLVEEGTRVEQGDTLVELDPNEYRPTIWVRIVRSPPNDPCRGRSESCRRNATPGPFAGRGAR